MIAVIPFCSADEREAKKLLEWILELGGCRNHSCLLVVDAEVDWSVGREALTIANKAFRSAKIIATHKQFDGPWPLPQNQMFRFTAEYVETHIKESWLWLEPDAIPLCPKWLETLDAEYQVVGKPYMGKVMPFENGKPLMPSTVLGGVAIYPAKTFSELGNCILTRINTAWDVTSSFLTVPQAHDTGLIHWLWGMPGNPPRFAENAIAHTNVFSIRQLNPGAVLFHRNKDGTLIHLLSRKYFPEKYINVFAHGGDVGDLMYGLPAMKAIGVGMLILHHHPVREPFSEVKFEKIAPLLRLQPYFTDVQFQHDVPNTKWNFNPFRQRNWAFRNGKNPESLCQSHFRIFGLPEAAISEPWLTVDTPTRIPNYPVVFHRSPRYHNGKFPWKQVYQAYGRSAVFVGMPKEHQEFSQAVGRIEYYPTADYLELARVIAGCSLFIGNQSCPYAMAEGLKKNAILEAFYHAADCQFSRPNLQNHLTGRIRIMPLEEILNPQERSGFRPPKPKLVTA